VGIHFLPARQPERAVSASQGDGGLEVIENVFVIDT
jgi:hypothetical protein